MARCGWCPATIPAGMRRDAKFCSKRCRQASHRFGRDAPERERAALPMRFGYGDPPYPGKALLYRDHPDYLGEVDHGLLIGRLRADYPDGWALSTSAEALPMVLGLCGGDAPVSVAAWFRGFRPHRSASRPLSSWEPVVYCGGRQVSPSSTNDASGPAIDVSSSAEGDASSVATGDSSALAVVSSGVHRGVVRHVGGRTSRRILARSVGDRVDGISAQRSLPAGADAPRVDGLVFPSRIRSTDAGRVIGAKPARFAYWLFDLLGARPGDEFDDLFPGSGGVLRAWHRFAGSDDQGELLA